MESSFNPEEPAYIRKQVAALAAKDTFKVSERLIKFLTYIVEEELSGRGSELNQSSIAMEVFERGTDFDPGTDSIVRVEAGRLRTKLRDYYLSEGSEDNVRFELPKGRYRPEIVYGKEGGDVPTPEKTKQEIRYCTSQDQVSIAYAVSGGGPPLVKAANWLSHLEYDFNSPVWNHWWTALSNQYRLIRYDERGCGLSDWEIGEFSFEAWVQDLELVVDTVGLERFPLLGISQGASVAISYAVKHPERVSHLILYGGYAQGSLKRSPDPDQKEEIQLIWDIMRVGWGQEKSAFRKLFASFFMPDGTPEQYASFSELQRMSTSPENAEQFMKTFNHIDVTDLLRQVTAQTLIIHGRGDLEVPHGQSQLMAKHIPDAKLVTLESRNHILGEHEPAWVEFLGELNAFLAS